MPNSRNARTPLRHAGQGTRPGAGGPAETSRRVGIDRDLSAVAEQAIAATVEISGGDGFGAGVLVHPDGLVLTARHVAEDEDGQCVRSLRVTLADGRRAKGLVFRAHGVLDMALLWLTRAGPFPSLAIGDPRVLRTADTIVAVGHPASFRNTVSLGIVSNPCATVDGVEFIQTDAAADEGNSGGPIVNRRGELVGINSWQYGSLDSGKFALPVDYVTRDIAEAVALGRRRCLLGRFCLACGHLALERRRPFCPVCGSRAIAWGE